MKKFLRTRDKYPDETWGSYIHRVLKGIALDDHGKDYIVKNEFVFELIKIVHSLKALAMEQATFCGYDEKEIEGMLSLLCYIVLAEIIGKERGFKDTYMVREYINAIIDSVPPTIN